MTGKLVMERLPFKRDNDLHQLNINAQSRELRTPTEGKVRALWGEMELVENVNSRFSVPVATSYPVRSETGPLLPFIDEQPIISTAFVIAASQPTTPSPLPPPNRLRLHHQQLLHLLHRSQMSNRRLLLLPNLLIMGIWGTIIHPLLQIHEEGGV